MHRFKFVLGENAKRRMFRCLSSIARVEARTLSPQVAFAERLCVVLISQWVENAFGHRTATSVSLRHEQHLHRERLQWIVIDLLIIEVTSEISFLALFLDVLAFLHFDFLDATNFTLKQHTTCLSLARDLLADIRASSRDYSRKAREAHIALEGFPGCKPRVQRCAIARWTERTTSDCTSRWGSWKCIRPSGRGTSRASIRTGLWVLASFSCSYSPPKTLNSTFGASLRLLRWIDTVQMTFSFNSWLSKLSFLPSKNNQRSSVFIDGKVKVNRSMFFLLLLLLALFRFPSRLWQLFAKQIAAIDTPKKGALSAEKQQQEAN